MFLTFEGMEGCGKSTQCKKLIEYFIRQGHDVLHTLEPGGSRLGKELRRILLDPHNSDLSSTSELFLYLADRAQHVSSVIRPAMEDGRTVICDRFADSTVVYQGYGRGLDPSLLHHLNDVAVQGLWPDVTILLDVAPEIGLKRALTRNMQDNKADRRPFRSRKHGLSHPHPRRISDLGSLAPQPFFGRGRGSIPGGRLHRHPARSGGERPGLDRKSRPDPDLERSAAPGRLPQAP